MSTSICDEKYFRRRHPPPSPHHVVFFRATFQPSSQPSITNDIVYKVTIFFVKINYKHYYFVCAGRRLNTAVLKKVHALSGPECVLHCFNDTCCRSVNFNKRCKSPGNCELLHDVPSEKPGNVIFDEGFDNLVLLQPSRVSSHSHAS